jgi:uncharacterized protein (DUF1697 family)
MVGFSDLGGTCSRLQIYGPARHAVFQSSRASCSRIARSGGAYVQSGNVVFKGPVGRAELIGAIEARISRDLGLDVTVLLRTRAELGKVVADNPFAGKGTDPAKLHVTFLTSKPGRDRVRELGETRAGQDEFRLVGREVYLHCPNGYGRTKLSNAYLEKRLGVAATTRNWKTVTKLAELTGT